MSDISLLVGNWYTSAQLSKAGLNYHDRTEDGTYVFERTKEEFYTAKPHGRHIELLDGKKSKIQLSKFPREFWEIKGKYTGKGPFQFGCKYARMPIPKSRKRA